MVQSLSVAFVGFALGILGYRVFRSGVALFGFAVGAVLVFSATLPLGGPLVALLAGLVGGAVGAVLSSMAEWASFGLAGATLGWLVVLAGATAAGFGGLAPVAALVGALFGGVLGVIAERAVVTAATALIGAWLVVQGVGAVLVHQPLDLHGAFPPVGEPWVARAAWIGLALVFAGLQLREDRYAGVRRQHTPPGTA